MNIFFSLVEFYDTDITFGLIDLNVISMRYILSDVPFVPIKAIFRPYDEFTAPWMGMAVVGLLCKIDCLLLI